MTVTKNDATAQSIEGSEQTDIDLEKQNTNNKVPQKLDIEHVSVKDDPRMWSRKRKVCTFWLSYTWMELSECFIASDCHSIYRSERIYDRRIGLQHSKSRVYSLLT